jgi:hypothetical protein
MLPHGINAKRAMQERSEKKGPVATIADESTLSRGLLAHKGCGLGGCACCVFASFASLRAVCFWACTKLRQVVLEVLDLLIRILESSLLSSSSIE